MCSWNLPKHSDLLEAIPDSATWRVEFGDPGSKATIALHIMPMKQPVRSQRFLFDVKTNYAEASMHEQAEEASSANDLGKSDDRIVPLKGDGKTRPLGLACVEDKIVQRAIAMVLERIYEVGFSDSSYGFRPGRSCHQVLSGLGQNICNATCELDE